MKYYPVFIPTLNRYTHLRRCIESLSRCTYAEETELIIGLDYPPSEKYRHGYNQIKLYLPNIIGFKKVTVIEHNTNLGPGKNWKFLMDYCFEKYDACIGSEDDNEFSPCFLDYMAKTLDRYYKDSDIVSVCGYNFEAFYDQKGKSVYKSVNSSAWGIGFWKHKELLLEEKLKGISYFEKILYSPSKSKKIIKNYPWMYWMLDTMVAWGAGWGDVKRSVLNILEHTYQIKPAISLVKNWGFDGSGEHSQSPDLEFQEISVEKFFFLTDEIQEFETKDNRLNTYMHSVPNAPKKKKEFFRHIRILQVLNNFPPFRIVLKLRKLKNRLKK